MSFKVGDTVICINDEGCHSVTKDYKYKILGINEYNNI